MKRIVCLVLALLCIVPLVAYGMVSDAAGTALEAVKTKAELQQFAESSEVFHGITAEERAEIIEIVEAWYAEYLVMKDEDLSQYQTSYKTQDSNEYAKAYYANTQYAQFIDPKYKAGNLRPTRTVESLEGWLESEYFEKEYELDVYGGWENHSFGEIEATGNFYVKKLGNRWYYINPLGNPCINIGVVGPLHSYNANTQQEAAALEIYGSVEKWAVYTVNHLKHEDGFNLVMHWAPDGDMVLGVPEGMVYQQSTSPMTEYGRTLDIVSQSGNTSFDGGAIPIFDPAFPEFAKTYLEQTVAPYLNDKRVVGFTTDNEFPMHREMVANYLTLDPVTTPAHRYSYAAAWTWYYKMTGIQSYGEMTKAEIETATKPYWDLFRGFVYYRYFSVLAPIMEEVAPDHMYGGHRFFTPDSTATVLDSEWIIRFAGKYCDYICLNWYRRYWTLTPELAANLTKWSGDKPFLITEFYAKSDLFEGEGDSRDVDSQDQGGGWHVDGSGQLNGVDTQVGTAHRARADYYENSTLAFLEWGNIVGWHWYRYNHYWLGSGTTLRSAGGIVNDDHVPYPEFEEAFQQINKHVYGLAEFFDERKENNN